MASSIIASSKPLISISSSTKPSRVHTIPKFAKPLSSSGDNLRSKAVITLFHHREITCLNRRLRSTSMAEAREKAALFDFNLTLSIIVVEFLFLMFALDKVYYSPLGNFMDQVEVEEKLTERRKTVEVELQEALASLEKQKEETIKALDSQIAALRASPKRNFILKFPKLHI